VQARKVDGCAPQRHLRVADSSRAHTALGIDGNDEGGATIGAETPRFDKGRDYNPARCQKYLIAEFSIQSRTSDAE
jgi:hypothetical protein